MPREPSEFPAGYDPADNVTLDVPKALVPLLAGLIRQWEWKAAWKTDTDWQQGYQAALLLQERLLS